MALATQRGVPRGAGAEIRDALSGSRECWSLTLGRVSGQLGDAGAPGCTAHVDVWEPAKNNEKTR